MSQENQTPETLDDPELLAERRSVREELEALTERYRRLDDEFIRRARAAWAHAS